MATGLVSLSVVVLVLACQSSRAQLIVRVYNESTTNSSFSEEPLSHYTDFTLFSSKYANVGDLQGFLYMPVPRNACSYVEPIPAGLAGPWFALVSDYPTCSHEMLVNIRAAGYSLIITSAQNMSDESVTSSIKDSGFPIIIVPQWYSQELYNFSSNNFNKPEFTVEVIASLILSLAVVMCSFITCSICCCCVCACCWRCKNSRSRRRAEENLFQYHSRQHNYEQIQRRERVARQELIESILRQLQELQVDLRTQTPLGAAETRRLPLRPYQRGENKCDTCAICVEDFLEGENLRLLPCDHSFHPPCIDEWLSNHSCLCPLCKVPVSQSNSEAVAITLDSDSASTSLLSSVESSAGRHYGSM